MLGFRKVLVHFIFSIFVLIYMGALQFSSRTLSQYEALTLIAILFIYPIFNFLSKLANKVLDEKVMTNVNKIMETYKKIKNHDEE